MGETISKMPNPNAVTELRERHERLKSERKSNGAGKKLAELFRKDPSKSDKKVAKKRNGSSEAEV